MCGILGFTGKKNLTLLTAMANEIFHRGPDDDGFYEGNELSFGMRRLSILDVKTGKQPIHNEDKTIWCVFNGEIYNFPELRIELENLGHKFYTHHSDTELIVHLYEEYGMEFPHKINGMFGIAIWDTNKKELLLIRDRMGVKPLFYAKNNRCLVFASEIKSILAHPQISKEPCFEALYHYFSLKNIPAPFTAFKNIFSLLPGEFLRYKNNNLSLHKWWTIKFEENEEIDETTCYEKILMLLEDATKIRMRCDVPFGAYLSGGVDSSAVVALMSRTSSKPIKTFSLGYEDELKNKAADIYFARKVSEMFSTEHHEYIMNANELISDIDSVIESFDQPFSGTISTFFLSKLIRKHVKVALSGDGADELFGSYLSHRIANPIWHFNRLQDKLNSGTITEEEKKLFLPCDIDYLKRLLEKSGNADEINWRYSLYLLNDMEKHAFFSDKFMNNVPSTTSTHSLLESHFKNLTAKGNLNRILEMEWKTQLPDNILAFVDFLSMAHSIEVRSPFLDYRLVNYASTIPDRLKIHEKTVKYILKKAVHSILPPGITDRPKEGFVLPVFDWMTKNIKNYTKEMLSADRMKKHGFFRPEAIANIWNNYESGDNLQAGKIWNIMMFQVWWEKYFG